MINSLPPTFPLSDDSSFNVSYGNAGYHMKIFSINRLETASCEMTGVVEEWLELFGMTRSFPFWIGIFAEE